MKNFIEYKGIWIAKTAKAYELWEAKEFRKLNVLIKLLDQKEKVRLSKNG